MKKIKNELFRMENVIKKDCINNSEKFNELFAYDLNRVIKNYFEINDQPIVKIEKTNNSLTIEIKFFASGLKSFNSIEK